MFDRLLGLHIMLYISRGLLPPDGILPGANLTLRPKGQVLRSPILAALLHGTRPVGVSQTLRRGTGVMNGITELSETAPPICRWAVIALGIGPHSSFI